MFEFIFWHIVTHWTSSLLNEPVTEEGLFLPRYVIHRADGETVSLPTQHSGVLFAVKGDPHKRCNQPVPSDSLRIQLRLAQTFIMLRCLYNPTSWIDYKMPPADFLKHLTFLNN